MSASRIGRAAKKREKSELTKKHTKKQKSPENSLNITDYLESPEKISHDTDEQKVYSEKAYDFICSMVEKHIHEKTQKTQTTSFTDCKKIVKIIENLIHYFEETIELKEDEREMLYDGLFRFNSEAANSLNDPVEKRRVLLDAIKEFDQRHSKKPDYESVMGFYLKAFAETFEEKSTASLSLALPTAKMFMHASSAGGEENKLRLMAALEGSIHVNTLRKVIFKDHLKNKRLYKALAEKLEDPEKLTLLSARNQENFCYDTCLNEHSLDAAHDGVALSVETALHCLEEKTNGLCLLRPPGHHAGRTVDGIGGFCVFNNVAYAMHAAARKLPKGKKIICIDVDIHSGDGTTEYVKEWDDKDHPLHFINLAHTGIFPQEKPLEENANNITNIKVDGSEKNSKTAKKKIINAILAALPRPHDETGVVFVSLGLDGHIEDNAMGEFILQDDFYQELFDALKSIYQPHQIPIIALLEGGYNCSVIQRIIHQTAEQLASPANGIANAPAAAAAAPASDPMQIDTFQLASALTATLAQAAQQSSTAAVASKLKITVEVDMQPSKYAQEQEEKRSMSAMKDHQGTASFHSERHLKLRQ